MLRLVDRWIAVTMLILCCVLYVNTLSFPPTAAAFPRALVALLAVVNMLLLISSFMKSAAQSPLKQVATKEVLITTALILLYPILIPAVGYYVTTVFFLFSLMWILHPKKPMFYMAISTVVTVIMYCAFTVFLKIWLPKGLLF